jgi:hypothetical protein
MNPSFGIRCARTRSQFLRAPVESLFDYVHFVPNIHHILPSLDVGIHIEATKSMIEAILLKPEYLSKNSALIRVFRGLKKHLMI